MLRHTAAVLADELIERGDVIPVARTFTSFSETRFIGRYLGVRHNWSIKCGHVADHVGM